MGRAARKTHGTKGTGFNFVGHRVFVCHSNLYLIFFYMSGVPSPERGRGAVAQEARQPARGAKLRVPEVGGAPRGGG